MTPDLQRIQGLEGERSFKDICSRLCRCWRTQNLRDGMRLYAAVIRAVPGSIPAYGVAACAVLRLEHLHGVSSL